MTFGISSIRRSSAALLTLRALFFLYVAAISGEGLHVLITPHETCAYHPGEIIHTEHGEKETPQHSARLLFTEGKTDSDSLHDHCLVAGLWQNRRKGKVLSSSADSLDSTPQNTKSLEPARVSYFSLRSILLVAPKTSPPFLS
jgi:hypothetical protein